MIDGTVDVNRCAAMMEDNDAVVARLDDRLVRVLGFFKHDSDWLFDIEDEDGQILHGVPLESLEILGIQKWC